jgi:hypothetical protein
MLAPEFGALSEAPIRETIRRYWEGWRRRRPRYNDRGPLR